MRFCVSWEINVFVHKWELEPPQLQQSQAPGQFNHDDVEFLILRQRGNTAMGNLE